MVFGFLKRSPESGYSLAAAASRAYEEARREGLPVARVAQHSPFGPQAWFADSLLRTIAVHGRRAGEDAHARLAGDTIRRMALADDFSALVAEGEPEIADLWIAESELKRYIAWARTVQ